MHEGLATLILDRPIPMQGGSVRGGGMGGMTAGSSTYPQIARIGRPSESSECFAGHDNLGAVTPSLTTPMASVGGGRSSLAAMPAMLEGPAHASLSVTAESASVHGGSSSLSMTGQRPRLSFANLPEHASDISQSQGDQPVESTTRRAARRVQSLGKIMSALRVGGQRALSEFEFPGAGA